MTRLGIDTGGTFTDVVSSSGRILKLSSTADDPSRAVQAAVLAMAEDGAGRDLVHGTTVATNAVLQGRLAPVGVLVNRGFRDLLFLGRQTRPDLYALEPRRPELPTRAELVAEVAGRLAPGGVELEALNPDEVLRAGRRLARRGAQALVVLFLHGYAHPAHEREALQALSVLDLPLTASSVLNPEFREYERGLTALVNAGLLPIVQGYLSRLQERLGRESRLSVMTSEGGLLSAQAAGREPARLLLSGPAAGLVAARTWARACGIAGPVLTLDMGGTSTDVSLIPDDLPLCAQLELAGLCIRLPGLDIHTIGAGGGSIAHEDAGGALAVGPRSAGCDPGPAACGRGQDVTVTDAHLLVGHLAPLWFAAGAEALDPVPAERCLRRLARRLDLRPRVLAAGIIELADVAMARALRVISVERGHDPRADVLVAFGGAGGLHAVSLARRLGMRRVMVPPAAGVLSAQGLLWSPPARTRSLTVLCAGLPGRAERRRLAKPMLAELRQSFVDEGFARSRLRASTHLDLRYQGQSFELQVREGPQLAESFHALHRERYGFETRDRPIELVALRCTVLVPEPPPELPRLARRRGTPPTPAQSQKAPLGAGPARPVFDRADLRAGDRIEGPALICDHTATVLLDGAARARVHARGALLIEVTSWA